VPEQAVWACGRSQPSHSNFGIPELMHKLLALPFLETGPRGEEGLTAPSPHRDPPCATRKQEKSKKTIAQPYGLQTMKESPVCAKYFKVLPYFFVF